MSDQSQVTDSTEGSVLGTVEQDTKQESSEQKVEQKTEQKVEQKTETFDAKSLKIPEGFTADEAQLSEFSAIFSDQTLEPNARAQKLLDLHTKALKAAVEGPSKAWDDLTVKWVGEIAADKDLGTGDAKSPLKPEVKAALSKIIDQVGGTELRQALDFTGAGNNPAIVRAFYKLGQQFTEGKPVQGNPPSTQRSGASALYPDLPPG